MDRMSDQQRTYGQRFKTFMLQNDEVTPLRKIYSVFIAIGLGLLIGMIPIEGVDGNSVLAYEVLFNNFTNSKALNDQLFNLFATYGLLALGTAIAFKAGVLNIGATGQFLAGGCLTLLLGIEYGSQLSQPEAIAIMFFVSTIGGAFVAVLAALLKVYFRINEVVTTLLLNWVVYYIFKIALFDLPQYKDPTGNFTKAIGDSFSFDIDGNRLLLPMILFGGAVVILFVILTFTSFGMKIKSCGNGFTSAKANGINVNRVFILTFAISGALCGLAGAIFYSFRERIDLSGSSLPLEGFNAIAIALLAYNQPVGVIFTSFFYSILEVGKPATNVAGISPEAMSLVLAIIIFFSALATIFIKTRPVKWMVEFFVSRNNKEYKDMREKYRNLKEKRDNNRMYAEAKTQIKHLNNVLQDRDHVKEKLHMSREEDGGVEGSIFTDSFYERENMINARKLKWRGYMEDIDAELSDLKSEMKIHRINYISEWYNGLTSFKLFMMRFIA